MPSAAEGTAWAAAMPTPVAALFLKKSLRLIPSLSAISIDWPALPGSLRGVNQTVEYFRQSVLILSISLGTPVKESSLPSYSADMKPL